MNNNDVLIFAEITPNFKISPVTFELARVGKDLTQKLSGAKLSAVIVNKCGNYSAITMQLAAAGFNKVYLIKNDCYKNYSTELYTNAVCELIKEIHPQILLIGATRTGRDLAPRISARMNLGLTADCTELDINEYGKLAATRPTFGGQLMATILSKSETQMATIRPNVFKKTEFSDNENIEIEEKFYYTTHAIDKTELLNFVPSKSGNYCNITESKIIVAAGKGVKNQEGMELVKKLAKTLNAQVGETRAVVDAGLADTTIQIGQTGKTVMPKLYIACGISGAIQHVVGMNMADKVIAINSDKNAPIFKHADYGIVGDVFEVLPQLIEIIKEKNDV